MKFVNNKSDGFIQNGGPKPFKKYYKENFIGHCKEATQS